MELIEIEAIKSIMGSIKKVDLNKDFKLKKSIEKYGQIFPIIINQDNEIIKGHNLFKVLSDLKIEKIWVKKINSKNKEQVYLELNFLQKEIDAVKSYKYMQKINLDETVIPFQRIEIENFKKLLSFDWSIYKNQEINSFF